MPATCELFLSLGGPARADEGQEDGEEVLSSTEKALQATLYLFSDHGCYCLATCFLQRKHMTGLETKEQNMFL